MTVPMFVQKTQIEGELMRKLVVFIAFLVLAALPVLAGDNYHYNANMNCSDCHSMHASAHNNLTNGDAITAPNTTPGTVINPYYPATSTPQPKLLKAADVCATCHDGQSWAPDVIGDNSNGYIRSAGGVREDAVGGGHKLGTTNRPPGYTNAYDVFPTGAELECVSCHSPHGGSNFRNLIPYAWRNVAGYTSALAPSVAKGAFDNAKDVSISNDRVFGTGNMSDYYGRAAVTYGRSATGYTFNGVTGSNRMDLFCGACHGQFHGGAITDTTVGDGSDFVRHPTSIVLIKDGSHGSSAGYIAAKGPQTLKVYTPDGTANGDTSSPGCVTCHKSHGNNNPFALIYPDRAAGTVPSEEGGGIYKDLCKTCHGMGGA
jgi:cytochrome c5